MHSFGLNDVFEEGWAAFVDGGKCPYSQGSIEWNAWHGGYFYSGDASMIGEYKLHSQGEFVTDEFGSFKPSMEKVDEYKREFDSYTSGLIKYTCLPQGTRVRLTLEIIE